MFAKFCSENIHIGERFGDVAAVAILKLFQRR